MSFRRDFDEQFRSRPPAVRPVVDVFVLPWPDDLPDTVIGALKGWEVRVHRLGCGHTMGPYLLRTSGRLISGEVTCSVCPRSGRLPKHRPPTSVVVREKTSATPIERYMRKPDPMTRALRSVFVVPWAPRLPADVADKLDGKEVRVHFLSCGHVMGPYLMPTSEPLAESRTCHACQTKGPRLRQGNTKSSTGTSRP